MAALTAPTSAAAIPRKLRVGVFADSPRQPRWLVESLARIANSDFAEICVLSAGETHADAPPALWNTYERVDRWLFGGPDPFERYSAAGHPLAPGTPLLLVHDRDDRRVPFAESERLLEVNAPAARLVATEGFGHNRVLRSDAMLDAVTAFLTASDAAIGAVPENALSPRPRPQPLGATGPTADSRR